MLSSLSKALGTKNFQPDLEGAYIYCQNLRERTCYCNPWSTDSSWGRQKSMDPTTNGRSRRLHLLEFVDRPLGFYVLSLLIVESFIGLVATLGQDSVGELRVGLYLGVGMFVYITLTVTLIVWKKAHVLTFDRDAHLTERQTSSTVGRSRSSNGDGAARTSSARPSDPAPPPQGEPLPGK